MGRKKQLNKVDFSGYATKAGIKCTDGRIINSTAFQHNDGTVVPLVWEHQRNSPENILGKALLENRNGDIYAYCELNNTKNAQMAKELIYHGDVDSLSIHANQLQENGPVVMHGQIREVSLVVSGANPGARIDNISMSHSDGSYTIDDSEAIIYSGIPLGELSHSDDDEDFDDEDYDDEDFDDEDYDDEDFDDEDYDDEDDITEEDIDDITEEDIDDFLDDLSDEELADIYQKVAEDHNTNIKHSGGPKHMRKRNIFENVKQDYTGVTADDIFDHSDYKAIVEDAQKIGSLKESFLQHAATYGIEDIGILFPDAQNLTNSPQFIKRKTQWVPQVLDAVKHSPFSRIKNIFADITADEARAKGYVKATLKKEEVIKLIKRITTPTTIYKKQKIDRDDMVDITSLDTVAWLKMEMRMMLEEEIARAILIGDGREADDPDKINEEHIRPVYSEADMFVHRVKMEPAVTNSEKIDTIIRSYEEYKGSGRPTLFTTTSELNNMLLEKDTQGRRLYNSIAELTNALRVEKIVEVPMLGNTHRTEGTKVYGLLGIIVNLDDYTVGADKGGNVSLFDDFDIDYNQYKYLIETRMCGALTVPKSAIILEQANN